MINPIDVVEASGKIFGKQELLDFGLISGTGNKLQVPRGGISKMHILVL
jgi:hypothetical protein